MDSLEKANKVKFWKKRLKDKQKILLDHPDTTQKETLLISITVAEQMLQSLRKK